MPTCQIPGLTGSLELSVPAPTRVNPHRVAQVYPRKGQCRAARPPEPGTGPDDDIPVEVFLREQQCGTRLQTAHSQSVYRVGYRFNDEERVAELPYDPGEALLVSASGDITGPARKRLD